MPATYTYLIAHHYIGDTLYKAASNLYLSKSSPYYFWYLIQSRQQPIPTKKLSKVLDVGKKYRSVLYVTTNCKHNWVYK